MAVTDKKTMGKSDICFSFEFFPPKSTEMETQLWAAVTTLSQFGPDFVSVTYGAGGTTREPSLAAVRHLIAETPLKTAAHLTCVGATCEEVAEVVSEYRSAGVRHFVALRGDPPAGIGSRYVPHPGGFENAAALVAGLRAIDDFEISVSAYPERHPESGDWSVDIDMLKRKVDNGATRALSQFFFDNDRFERYLERVRAAGIDVPVVPGIMPIQNFTQMKRFAGLCGASVPAWLENRFAGLDDRPEARADAAAEIAAEQIADLERRGIREFHIYTMNKAPLVSSTLRRLGVGDRRRAPSEAAA